MTNDPSLLPLMCLFHIIRIKCAIFVVWLSHPPNGGGKVGISHSLQEKQQQMRKNYTLTNSRIIIIFSSPSSFINM